ncbi:hypothetical protein [Scytonema millei]|uniref:hypothetical protein n=1 Tax=Scytonema millei TaxID=1245922 RepID=UPI0013F4A378|nr:hypothetical protein [Scytonema millei]
MIELFAYSCLDNGDRVTIRNPSGNYSASPSTIYIFHQMTRQKSRQSTYHCKRSPLCLSGRAFNF